MIEEQDPCFVPLSRDIEVSLIPVHLNDPFVVNIPPLCELAVEHLQEFLMGKQDIWKHNFGLTEDTTATGKGKMFGVLVVQKTNGELGYLSTFSGKAPDDVCPPCFVPSLFDVSTDDYFINRGMTELTAMGVQIKQCDRPQEIQQLKAERKSKSIALQQKLFDCYIFLNEKGEYKSLCDIYATWVNPNPPAGAGECAAPKLFQYAFERQMRPLGIAEFWWGVSPKSGDKVHCQYYPSCHDKCRPILGHMLSQTTLI